MILNRRWLKYRLRTLMLVILVAGLCLTGWRRMQEHEQTVVVLAKAKHLEPALKEPRWIDRVTHADLRQVTRASFHGVATIGDEELAQLRRCAGLKRLSLYRTSVTDEGMENLQAFIGLKVLSLEHTAITDAGLEHLAGLRRLEELQLSHSKVQGLGLQHPRANCGSFEVGNELRADCRRGSAMAAPRYRDAGTLATRCRDRWIEPTDTSAVP
jgi:hypothetical protein